MPVGENQAGIADDLDGAHSSTSGVILRRLSWGSIAGT
jgi:hypothetical protein